MDLALDNLQRLICHKTQTNKLSSRRLFIYNQHYDYCIILRMRWFSRRKCVRLSGRWLSGQMYKSLFFSLRVLTDWPPLIIWPPFPPPNKYPPTLSPVHSHISPQFHTCLNQSGNQCFSLLIHKDLRTGQYNFTPASCGTQHSVWIY